MSFLSREMQMPDAATLIQEIVSKIAVSEIVPPCEMWVYDPASGVMAVMKVKP